MKHQEEAAIGDTVELTAQWSDVSGIPLFTFPAGSSFKVLWPDLTTGGVIVYEESNGLVFSLAPDRYRVVDVFDDDEDGEERDWISVDSLNRVADEFGTNGDYLGAIVARNDAAALREWLEKKECGHES